MRVAEFFPLRCGIPTSPCQFGVALSEGPRQALALIADHRFFKLNGLLKGIFPTQARGSSAGRVTRLGAGGDGAGDRFRHLPGRGLLCVWPLRPTLGLVLCFPPGRLPGHTVLPPVTLGT